MKTRIDLNILQNDNCKTSCNKDKRKSIAENDICSETISVIDGLPVRCVGKWAVEKIYHLVQYFTIFSNGMKYKWKGELNYIEICSGPGRNISRENGSEFDGTSLSIINNSAYKNIKKALFFDFNKEVVNTLNQRISNLQINNAFALFGDYTDPNIICDEIKKQINPNSLNLVFIDPTDCSVPFLLVKRIKDTLPNVDFIINLASGTDYNRNILNALVNKKSYSKVVSKYVRFLGDSQFFEDGKNIQLALENMKMSKEIRLHELRNNFRESYKNSLRKLGYKYFDFIRIKHFYDLIFASKNQMGLRFWEEAGKVSFDGQRKLL